MKNKGKDDQDEDNDNAFSNTLLSGLDEKTRTVYVVGEIGEQHAYHFMAALSHLDATEGNIRIVISSVGGDENCGYAMFDCLRSTKNIVVAEGYGIVASMASALFQGADIRCLSENCQYMIHNGSISDMPGENQQDTIIKLADKIKADNQRYYQILYDNSSLTWEEIESFCKDEKWFSAKEAIDNGLADMIIKPHKKRTRRKPKKRKK